MSESVRSISQVTEADRKTSARPLRGLRAAEALTASPRRDGELAAVCGRPGLMRGARPGCAGPEERPTRAVAPLGCRAE